jgi:hypothetical protein
MKLLKKLMLCVLIVQWFVVLKGQQNPNGLSFDGVNDFVTLGTSSLLKPTSAITVEAWVNLTSWNNSNSQIIISNLNTFGYQIKVQDGSLTASVYRNGSLGTATYNVSSFSGWHYVGVTFDGRYIRLYTDAALRNTNDALATYTITYDVLSSTNIGSDYSGSTGFVSGTIDEVRVWSIVRAPAAATIITEVLPTTAGLVAYYRANIGTAGGTNTGLTTLTDLTTNGLSGTLANFNLSGSSSNWIEGRTLKPVNQSTGVTVTNLQPYQLTFSWTRPGSNMGGNVVKVFMRQATSGNATPVDGTDYTANSVFGSGAQIGSTGYYCVYDGTGNSATVTNLQPTTTYRIHVVEYQYISGQIIRYYTSTATNNPINKMTDYIAPTSQASNIGISNINGTSFTASWTRGDGSNCIVFVKQATSGSASPVNNTTYTANPAFRSGTQIGTSGWYCVYKGTGTTVNVTALSSGLPYQVMVCEYNGTAALEKYLTVDGTNNPINYSPDYSTPSIQASTVAFSNLNGTSVTVGWSRGNGSNCIVFALQGNTGSAAPANNTTYLAGAAFKGGTQIGSSGWYCVYKGAGTSVTVTGLNVNSTYRFMVCEYNGTSGYEKYLTTTSTDNPNNQLMDYSAPATQATNITFSNVNPTSFTASLTRGNGTNCIIFVRLGDTGEPVPVNNTTYTASTTFGSGSQISGWFCVFKGTVATVTVTGLTPAQTYRVMACEYNGTVGYEKYLTSTATGNPNNQVAVDYSTPTTQASNIIFSAVNTNRFTVSWTNGNGSNRTVFVKLANTGTPPLVDNTTYTANTVFGSGSQVDGWSCVYKGTGTTVTVTGLTLGLEYIVMVCEYNGTASKEKYNTLTAANNPLTQITDYPTPTTQTYNVAFSALTGTGFSVSWTRGNGSRRAVFATQSDVGTASPANNSTYTASTIFGSGTQIGLTGWFCIYDGTGTTVAITGLTPGLTYRIMSCEYNGTSGMEKYLTTTGTNNPNNRAADYTAPTVQALNISFSNVQATSFTASWTRGNGSNRAVFVKADNTGTANPVSNTTYNANGIFGSGTQIGETGWFCVYNGTGITVNVTGLTELQSYQVMVCDYNGIAGFEKYNISSSTNNPNSSSTSYTTPTTQASLVYFNPLGPTSFKANWTRGDGTNCIVFIAQASSGEPSPVDNTSYTANTIFGSGSQISTSGWYCIYKGAGTSVTTTGLTLGLSYRVMVLEFNGSAAHERYLTITNTGNPANQVTDYVAPTTQALNVSCSAVNYQSLTASWTRGNGSGVAVFMLDGSVGEAAPVNNTTYTASSTFGSGTPQAGAGWYCIYKGTGTSVAVTGLLPGHTYRVMACEYNGTTGNEKYLTSTSTNNPNNQTTLAYVAPTTQANSITFTSIGITSYTVNWTRGNGSRCAVFIYQGSTGNASPVTGTTYTANTVFGSGSQAGTGWYCVFNGSGTSVTITGMTTGVTYRVMVFEYNGINGYETFNTNTATNNPNNKAPDYLTPSTQADNLDFTNVLSSGFTASWTRGSGSSCIVFVRLTASGTPAPVNNTTYAANSVFGSGSEIGSSGWFCVYKGSGTTVDITGLTVMSTYRVMVCEYNGIAGFEKYLTYSPGSTNPKNQMTDAVPPTIQSSEIIISAVATTTFDISWTRGNGAKSAVFIKAGNSGTATPVNNTTYTANSVFGLGTQIGTSGWYCVFNNSATVCSITGLTPGTQYRVMACEYFGGSGSEKYNISTASNNPNNTETYFEPPTIQASSVSFPLIIQTSATVNWTRGDGINCAVFIAQTTTGSASPDNFTTYTANTQYASGSQIGSTGWYCIYNGSGTSVTVTGLTNYTAYRVMVVEYTNSPGRERYLTDGAALNPNNFTTLIPLTTWNGTTWNYGPPNMYIDATISGHYRENAEITCKDLTINATDSLIIQPGYALTVHGNLTNSGIMVLRSPSNMTASGSLITYGNITNNLSGKMFAERYITPGTQDANNYFWHNMSTPVDSFKAQTLFGTDYVLRYVERTNTFQSLVIKDMINIGIGYWVKTIHTGGKIVKFTGTYNTGNQSMPLVNTGADEGHGYNLIGNPYPSAIDWDASSGITKTNISEVIWIWNPEANDYASWDGTVGTNGGSQFIPAMQGFMVKVNAGNSTGSVSMTNSARVHNTGNYLKSGKIVSNIIRLRANNKNLNDEMAIYWAEGKNEAYKLFSPNMTVPQVYVINDGTEFSIYKMNSELSETTIQLGFRCTVDGLYKFIFDEIQLQNSDLKVYLKDKITGLTVPVSSGDTYQFMHNSTNDNNRFDLIIQKGVLMPDKVLAV